MSTNVFNRSNVVSILIAAMAVGYAIWSSTNLPSLPTPEEETTRPKYYIPNFELLDRLEHVQDAFDRAGYVLVTNANYSDDWHTMWTFHNPFWQREKSVDLPAMMQQLKSHQKVNHLPGASHFTSKVDLAKYTENLTFVPKSFLLPQKHSEFLEYQKLHPNVTWVRKSRSHRGVRIVHPKDPSLVQEETKESIVQQFIRPYLIDKRLWDVGVYIAITSVNPLRLYYFDNILVRACREEFVEDLEKAPRDAYVVDDDYMPPWGMPSFRPYYTWGMSTLNVLRAFFHSQGVAFDDVFHEMRANILELVGYYIQNLERSAARFPHGQSSFFSLYRVDFLLDRNLKPWITEINQSPNLSSHHFSDLATMFQRIAYSLLSLVGLTPGGMHHPSSTDRDLEVLLHANDIDIAYSICQQCNEDCHAFPNCALCRPCRTPDQSAHLKALIGEQRSRLGFIPLYPLRNSSLASLQHLSISGDDNALLQSFVVMKCTQDVTWC